MISVNVKAWLGNIFLAPVSWPPSWAGRSSPRQERCVTGKAGCFYLLGMPLALGSYWGLLVLVPMMAAVIWRLFDEEELLARGLPGYAEYERAVRWRLIPGIF
ncbi:MAG: hypothetical protein ACLQFW_14875 [Xanthobacteraceae bacterium]